MVIRPALAVGLILLVGLAGCGGGSSAESPSPTSPTTPAAELLSMPTSNGNAEQVIAPGSYRIPSSVWSAAEFTVTFPEGWTVQYGHVYHQNDQQGETAEFYAIDLDEIYTDSCHGEGIPQALGPGVDDLVTALLAQKGPVASEPVETTLGGYPATRIDLAIPKGLDLADCRLADDGVLGLQLWYSAPADKYFVLQPSGAASIYVLDVDGDRQVFLTQQFSPAREHRAEVQDVLDSIRVG
ncbi:MAG: hypothetical protein ACRDO4_00275 [Nocardioides sp.]